MIHTDRDEPLAVSLDVDAVPVPTFHGVVTALHEAHSRGLFDPCEILTEMLTAAGARSSWDSETIETVLRPTEITTSAISLPFVGSTTDTTLRFWAAVAHDVGMEHDWEHLCPECGALLDDSNEALSKHHASVHPGV